MLRAFQIVKNNDVLQPPRSNITDECNDGCSPASPRTTFAPLEYGILMNKCPAPPTTQAPSTIHRRVQHQLQWQVSDTFIENNCNVNRSRMSGSDAMGQHEMESGKGEGRMMSKRPTDESTGTKLKVNTSRAERSMKSQVSGDNEPEVHFPEVKGSGSGGGINIEKSEFEPVAVTDRSSMFGSNFKSCFKNLLANRY